MAVLLHGTTQQRAEQIMAQGPDPDFIEPGGGPRAGSFSACLALVQRILTNPSGGVTGLVDELLSVCRKQGLQLEWQMDRCRLRSFGGDWEQLAELSLGKSVFRAILARFAALCNEQTPNSVSPYGGQGELTIGTNPPAIVSVSFVNTPAEQKLELLTVSRPEAGHSR